MSPLRIRSCILLILLASAVAFSQVHIRERLEVKSQQAPVRSLQGVGEMTPATLELIWDAPDDVTLSAETPCGSGQLSESGPGMKVYTFPGSVAGQYFFRIFYYGCSVFGQPAAPPANITGTLTFGSDTPIVFHGTVQPRSDCMGAPNSFEFTYVHTTPYVSLSDFILRPTVDVVTEGQGTDFLFEPLEGCVDTRWYPENDPITLTIVSGSAFGKFGVGDDPALVTTVTFLVSELPTVRFIPSGRLGTYPVRIEARCLSLVRYWEFDVRYCSILLGEAKYFYVVQESGCETYPRIKIYETDSPVRPPGAEATDVWVVPDEGEGSSPVRNSGNEENSGSRLGVYWEKNKPIPGGASNLPVGMIRLVGRYWHPDSVYTVDLMATKKLVCWGREGIIADRVPIEVKKPARLLTPGQSPTYAKAKDVLNNVISIDDTCIVHGGRYGIPPQFIKAHMDQEAAKKNFSGEIGWGFAPSYRFEPYAAQTSYGRAFRRHKYFVDKNRTPATDQMGTGKPIPDHQNVLYLDYPRTPLTLWDVITQYSQLVDPGGSSLYGKRRSDGFMDYYAYPSLQHYYWIKIVDPLLFDKGYRGQELADAARNQMINYVRYERSQVDLNAVSAQTRIKSSYGLLQITYETARDETVGYPYDQNDRGAEDNPERLNVTEIGMLYSMKHMNNLLNAGLDKLAQKDHDWPGGLEEYFKNVVYQNWNPGDTQYGDKVKPRIEKFKPSE